VAIGTLSVPPLQFFGTLSVPPLSKNKFILQTHGVFLCLYFIKFKGWKVVCGIY